MEQYIQDTNLGIKQRVPAVVGSVLVEFQMEKNVFLKAPVHTGFISLRYCILYFLALQLCAASVMFHFPPRLSATQQQKLSPPLGLRHQIFR